MLLNIIDKIIFGGVLLLALQVPILADHYGQFVSGELDATQKQVEGYATTAAAKAFSDVKSMIDKHLQNAEPSVRMDAEQKLQTLREFEELKTTALIFAHGNILQKAYVMFKPTGWRFMFQVLPKFKPGIPLSMEYIAYAALLALCVSTLLIFILKLCFRRKSTLNQKPVLKQKTA